jgi:hypothetical protein
VTPSSCPLSQYLVGHIRLTSPGDIEEFAKLIGHPDPARAQVELMDPADWDRNGQYETIVDAVREVGKGNDVMVYRIAMEGARAGYWVVTTDGKEKLVGVMALAVES